jgi:hypothetical protein
VLILEPVFEADLEDNDYASPDRSPAVRALALPEFSSSLATAGNVPHRECPS